MPNPADPKSIGAKLVYPFVRVGIPAEGMQPLIHS